jgi:hypothetical protein
VKGPPHLQTASTKSTAHPSDAIIGLYSSISSICCPPNRHLLYWSFASGLGERTISLWFRCTLLKIRRSGTLYQQPNVPTFVTTTICTYVYWSFRLELRSKICPWDTNILPLINSTPLTAYLIPLGTKKPVSMWRSAFPFHTEMNNRLLADGHPCPIWPLVLPLHVSYYAYSLVTVFSEPDVYTPTPYVLKIACPLSIT